MVDERTSANQERGQYRESTTSMFAARMRDADRAQRQRGGACGAPRDAPGGPIRRTAAAIDQCQLYGFARGTWDYAACRIDVRHYWTTGPCGSPSFAALHRGYCHLNLPPFI